MDITGTKWYKKLFTITNKLLFNHKLLNINLFVNQS